MHYIRLGPTPIMIIISSMMHYIRLGPTPIMIIISSMMHYIRLGPTPIMIIICSIMHYIRLGPNLWHELPVRNLLCGYLYRETFRANKLYYDLKLT